MKRTASILFLFSIILMMATACVKEAFNNGLTLPEGTPVTLDISFGAEDPLDVQIGTKAEVSRADESRIHDLYVLLFDANGDKFYGRYFTYEHQTKTLDKLKEQKNEGWFVENLQLTDKDSDKKVRGVVKIATVAKQGCTLVLLANVSNAITALNGENAVDWLTEKMNTLDDFNKVRVTLEQDIVNRADLFLMMGKKEGCDTGAMSWETTGGEPQGTYGEDYRIDLKHLDAKVKFRVRYDETKISAITPRFWQVFNVPTASYLSETPANPSDVPYFNTEEAYFEGTEREGDVVWQVFSFYMLENKPECKTSANQYYLRERQEKEHRSDGNVDNGDWVYAPQNGTYVKFDVILTLKTAGIHEILDDTSINHALTSDALFTVHLGDFTSSETGGDYDNYKVERGHSYTYDITVINSRSIYIEVMDEEAHQDPYPEDEPGQEGSLLLTSDEIINCDAHYEYHSMVFKHNPLLVEEGAQKNLSWYVKTPFGEGRPKLVEKDGKWHYEIPVDEAGNPTVDCKWVMFRLNDKEGEKYSEKRVHYPGLITDGANPTYKPDWDPESEEELPALIDINQLVNFLFIQNQKYAATPQQTNYFDSEGELRFTAFVDEFYYEKHPLSGEVSADLWREFINAKPRELHILSAANYSADLQSDVIKSSHSIIQNSIQSFYNIYSPDLSSIWGTEHKDEMRNRGGSDVATVNKGWSWWHGRWTPAGIINNEENGRINTANIWEVNSSTQNWSTFLDYSVNNDTPELRTDYQHMAYSCLTRNRDNNGNGIIDPEEVRWYTASINQLVGLWIGNESLSQSARIYQPVDRTSSNALEWRAHVLSSTCPNSITNPRVVRGEEGSTKSNYDDWSWAFPPGVPQEYRDRIASVRCVRNAGTYLEGGTLTDISYAPFDRMPDQYYEVEKGTDNNGKAYPNDDGTYTVRFSRLNPKSLREFTEEDLPYHDEYALHNRVYLELNMQAPGDYVIKDGSLNKEMRPLNQEISDLGFNPFCPPGYRVPNMTELLFMSDILPGSYWASNQGGNADVTYPCRTYFSRGIIGDNQTTTEKNKIGWQYNKNSGRVNLKNDNQTNTGIRCVRDRNMTGDITGKVIVANYDHLVHSTESATEKTTIELNFSSMASALREIKMWVIYLDENGNEIEVEIEEANALKLSGVTLNTSFSYTLPTVADLPAFGWMTVRARVRNAAGIYRDFETPVRLLSTVFTSVRLLPCTYDPDDTHPPFPVLITASSDDDNTPITGWRLRVTAPNGQVEYPPLNNQNGTYWSTILKYDYGQLQTGTYTFQLEADCGEGKDKMVTRSETASMEVLKVNYQPNVENPADPWKHADQITGKWERQQINDLYFHAGDFIETDMDISNCIYKRYPATGTVNNKLSLGMDNLISIGLNDCGWVPWTFHVYYPSINNNESRLYFSTVWTTTGTDLLNSGYNYSTPDSSAPLHFRIDKDGIYWNSQRVDFNRWPAQNVSNVQSVYNKFISANTLYIGSTEGDHRSRAIYRFVRVVHNGQSNADGGPTSFNGNPVNGGNL